MIALIDPVNALLIGATTTRQIADNWLLLAPDQRRPLELQPADRPGW